MISQYNIDTKINLQIGDPMDQGCSHMVHNVLYNYANINAITIPVRVGMKELEGAIAGARAFGLDFTLTMPLKSAIIDYLDEVDEMSREFKCVNNVKYVDGKLIGTGLDGVGMGAAIKHRLGDRIIGRNVLVLGGGAVAGPIAAALAERGVASITIANRTVSKAEYIADILKKHFPELKVSCGPLNEEFLNSVAPESNIVVQCTSMGGGTWEEFKPISFMELLPKDCLVADVLYPVTTVLTEAARLGLETLNGQEMILHQQIATMEFRFGIKLPDEALLVAEEALDMSVAKRAFRNRMKAQQK
ncbi:MAG: hypothetical protein IJC24_03650 [Clostridia bacterium]|nr:hypothetical protein [Clostridia bacterium]